MKQGLFLLLLAMLTITNAKAADDKCWWGGEEFEIGSSFTFRPHQTIGAPSLSYHHEDEIIVMLCVQQDGAETIRITSQGVEVISKTAVWVPRRDYRPIGREE